MLIFLRVSYWLGLVFIRMGIGRLEDYVSRGLMMVGLTVIFFLISCVANGDGFDDHGYDDGVGVVNEYRGFGWEGVVCVCKTSVREVPNLSKGVVCGAVVESVISVAISESFILVGIGGYWDRNWVARGLCFPGADDGSIEYDIFVT